ncbi:MAG TPA: endonuclease/exonuclease/phosphatase family protein [Roseomonas sp.]
MRPTILALLSLLLAWPALADTELKIATWNIAWLTTKPTGHPDLPRDVRTRSPEDFTRLQAYAARLDAAVIALQEVDGPLAAARVFDNRDYVIHLTDENDVQRPGFAWRRNLRVTRNPDLVGLDLRPSARFSLRRGADITVETEGGSRLRLLSIHLNAGCREGPIARSERRECDSLGRQIPVLAGWIAERRREGVPFMILGDFNRRIGRNDELFEQLSEAAPLTHANAGFSNPCWGGGSFIDQILVGGAARGWVEDGSLRVLVYAEQDRRLRDRLSDHCPVSLRVRMP